MSDAAHPPVPGPPRGAGAAPLDDVARPDSHPSGAASTRRTGAAPLDDVMMAMDVVDTLRHREQWVNRELDESGRQAALLERLRQI